MDKAYFRSLSPVNFDLADAQEADVTFRYFRDAAQGLGKVLTKENVAEEIDRSLKTVVFIHGWKCGDRVKWYDLLKEEYFKLGPQNIIYVHWTKPAAKSKAVSSANVKVVGETVAQLLVESGIDRANIHIVGHSFGGQAAAFVGKHTLKLTGEKLGRITGLDPAGPKFEKVPPKFHLTKADAEFVDVIHTDLELFGFIKPVGHVDFYPNGGRRLQPGCPDVKVNDKCSHNRSIHYFIESISRRCVAKEAVVEESDGEVEVKVKDGGKEVVFGEHVDESARGTFYFETNAEAPFLRDTVSKL